MAIDLQTILNAPAFIPRKGKTRRFVLDRASQLISGGINWKNPEQLSMTADCSWDEGGLYFHFSVKDDHIYVNRDYTPVNIFRNDCPELWFAPADCSVFHCVFGEIQCMQMHFEPADESGKVRFSVFMPKTPQSLEMNLTEIPEGLITATGKTGKTGYEIDVRLDKAMFTKGEIMDPEIRMELILSKGEPGVAQYMMMGLSGNLQFFRNPASYGKYALTEKPDGTLERLLWHRPFDNAVIFGKTALNLPEFEGEVSVNIYEPDGTLLYEGKPSAEKNITVNGADFPDCACYFAVILHQNGKPAGAVAFQVMNIGGLTRRISELDRKDVFGSDPAKAAAWLSVFAKIETLKAAVNQLKDTWMANQTWHEIQCRLALIDGKPLPDDLSLYESFLELGKGHEDKLSVEIGAFMSNSMTDYSHAHCCFTLKNGSLPIAIVQSGAYSAEAVARNRMKMWRLLAMDVEELDFPGADEAFSCSIRYYGDALASDYDVNYHVALVLNITDEFQWLLPFTQIAEQKADAVCIMPGTPEEIARLLRNKAASEQIPEIAWEDAPKYPRVLAGGKVPKPGLYGSDSCGYRTRMIYVRRGSWVASMDDLVPELSRSFLDFIVNRKPWSEAQYEKWRSLRSDYLQKRMPAAEPAPGQVFNGDVHTHTIFSDGRVTPMELLFEAPYAGLDFVIGTDHNCVLGSLLTKKECVKSNCRIPFICGEEITLSHRYHINLYPLTEYVDCNLPLPELFKAARKQGALIHWSHPTHYGPVLNRYWFSGTPEKIGFDMIERNMMYRDKWKALGYEPLWVGSTDTHTGVFCQNDYTVLCTETMDENGLKDAVRNRRIGILNIQLPEYVYGDKPLQAAVIRAFADFAGQQRRYLERIKAAFAECNIPELLQNAPCKHALGNTQLLVNPENDTEDFGYLSL